jgi:hypothetical protein
MATPVVAVTERNGPTGSAVDTELPLTSGVVQYAVVDLPSTTVNLSIGNGISPGSRAMEKYLRAKVDTSPPTAFDSLSVVFSAVAIKDSANAATGHVFQGLNTVYAQPVTSASGTATADSLGQTVVLPGLAAGVGSFSEFVVEQFNLDAGAALGDFVFPSPHQTWTYSYH